MARIILDRSVFHGNRFTILEASILGKLHSQGIVEVLFTTNFIEETLRYSQVNPDQFARHWQYLRRLDVKSWFRDPEEIVPLELSGRQRPSHYQYYASDVVDRISASIDDLARGKTRRNEIADAVRKTQSNFDHLDSFRATVLQTRPDWRQRKPSFEEFFESNVEYWIREGVMYRHKNSGGFLDFWRSNRRDCPFTEYFLKGWLAAVYVPLADQSFPVDRNDKIDAQQLSFTHWADVFVSDDRKFVRRAFDLLFPPPNKLLLDSEQLIRLLQSIAPSEITLAAANQTIELQ